MIKRVNSTGRKRIPRTSVEIQVYDGDPRSFDATLDLNNFRGPKQAEVVLEATCAGSNVVRRFAWGTLAELHPPADRSLVDLHGHNVFFSLKVIDRSEKIGRILGYADNIRPINGGEKVGEGRRGILPIDQADLGDELWRIDVHTEDVFLVVNNKIPDLYDRMRYDPLVYSLVYPAVVRNILRLAAEEQEDLDGEDERWPTLWLRFGKNLHPQKSTIPSEVDEREEWIEEVVQEFCQSHLLREKFVESQGRGSWGNQGQ